MILFIWRVCQNNIQTRQGVTTFLFEQRPGKYLANALVGTPELHLVLASTSPYRRALLERLGLPFEVAHPNIDESRLTGEEPSAMAERLAIAKACAVAPQFVNSQIIGSDQVAVVAGEIIGKPGNFENARRQLRTLSGQSVTFLTALCVKDSGTGKTAVRLIPSEVKFRVLSDRVIDNYLRRDRPYDCAASAKSESLGIALLKSIRGDDPNALIGLPLIALVDLLQEHGVDVL